MSYEIALDMILNTFATTAVSPWVFSCSPLHLKMSFSFHEQNQVSTLSPPSKYFNCQTLVDSHCFSLVSISDADFTIIKATQFQRLVQLLHLNYHRLWTNILLFDTVVHGDVLRFAKFGSVSPLCAIPRSNFSRLMQKVMKTKNISIRFDRKR